MQTVQQEERFAYKGFMVWVILLAGLGLGVISSPKERVTVPLPCFSECNRGGGQ